MRKIAGQQKSKYDWAICLNGILIVSSLAICSCTTAHPRPTWQVNEASDSQGKDIVLKIRTTHWSDDPGIDLSAVDFRFYREDGTIWAISVNNWDGPAKWSVWKLDPDGKLAQVQLNCVYNGSTVPSYMGFWDDIDVRIEAMTTGQKPKSLRTDDPSQRK